MIRIKRDSQYADRVRAYKVVLDGQVIGAIKNGQRAEFGVAPGRHQLHLKIDWCRSNIVDFEVDQDTVEFECGNSMRGFGLLLAVVYVTLFYNRYLWLKKL